ncbi:MAG: glycosyltransferase, partial [Flavisolibacter sp.]
WYPNKGDRFDGDFIQRHARAAAIYHDVYVLFITDLEIDKRTEEEWNYATGLTEHLIYFKKRKGLAARLLKQVYWRNLYQKAIKSYIAKNGLPDCVHVHVPWKAGLMALWMKKEYAKGFIITEHWGIYNRVVEDNFYARPKLVQTLLKKLFAEAKALVSVSQFLGKNIEHICGKEADVVIPNVVDTTLFFYKNEKYSRFTFIHVSNMVPLKNVKQILDAFKELLVQKKEDFQLILIGNRDREYPSYAEEIGLLNSSVFFTGEIPYNEVAEHMRRSHCFILNSIMENSPCVIGEALCCGLPVIATNVGGVPELVNETNGRLIPPNDLVALISAMADVYDNSPSFDHNQISDGASKRFGYSAISQKFVELYSSFC